MRTIITLIFFFVGLQIFGQTIAPKYGRIETRSRDTVITTCTQDGIPDLIFFRPPTYAFQTAVVITDDQGIILDENRPFRYNFEGGEPGICRAYGVTYIGLLKLKPGSHIDTLKINGTMIGITENYVKVKKIRTDGGIVSDVFGESTVRLCLGDDYPDTVKVANNSSVDENYTYILTDEQGKVLAIQADHIFAFNEASPGTCYIYGLSYSGAVTVEVGDQIGDIQSFSDQCFDLSQEPLTIIRQDDFSGTVTISSLNGDTINTCPGDGIPDQVVVQGEALNFPGFVYAITDTEYNILEYGTADTLNFEDAGAGTCLIWGIGYFGNLLKPEKGRLFESILASQCFDISENPITIIRENIEKTTVSSNYGDSVSFCAGDNLPDILVANSTKSISENYSYLLIENDLITTVFTDSLDLETIMTDEAMVFGISHTGTLNDVIGSSFQSTLSEHCYLLSDNFIFIEQAKVSGGKISSDHGDLVELCLQAGEGTEIQVSTENSGVGEYVYVLTDENSVILGFTQGAVSVHDSMNWNVLTVSGLSYQGDFTLQVMDTLIPDEVPGCVSFSENQIVINKFHLDGGEISASSGDSLSTCFNNPENSHVTLNISGSGDGIYQYLITDEEQTILQIHSHDSLELQSLQPGVTHIYAVNFVGQNPYAIGDTVNANKPCAAVSGNAIWIELIDLLSIVVNSSEGDSIYLCANAVKLDSITFSITPQVNNQLLILTNQDGHIITMSSGNTLSLDTSGTSNLRVYGATYTGNVILNIGDTFPQSILSDECFEIGENYLPIFMGDPNLVDGGTISSDLGSAVEFCVSDGIEDFIALSHVSSASSLYTYVVTNEEGNIIVTTKDSLLNFEGASGGVSRIYGLSHTNPIPNLLGRNVEELLPIGCYDFTDNFILITRSSVSEFLISSGIDGVLSVCIKPDSPESITVDFGNNQGGKQALIFVDGSGKVLQIIDSSSFVSNDLKISEAVVWGVSYGGNLTINVGDTITGKALSDLCFTRSNNFLNLSASFVEGGQISTSGGETEVTVCIENAASDTLFFTTSAQATQYAWIISNESGVVRTITTNDYYDFNNSGSESHVVTGIAYEGELSVKPGDTIGILSDLATGCFELSGNLILVNKERVEGGIIESPQGGNTIVVCSGDMEPDEITFQISDNQMALEAYVITDAIDNIVSIQNDPVVDFENVAEGICLVYGLTYSGNLLSPIGMSISNAILADDCFSLTSNNIEVVKSQPNGGKVESLFGDTTLQFCVSDDQNDRVFFTSSTSSLADYQYVITDTNNVVQVIPNIPAYDFEGSGAGTWRVWGISLTGELLVVVGEDLDSVALGTDCYDLSSNYIQIEKFTSGELCQDQANINYQKIYQVKINPNPAKVDLQLNIETLWPDFGSVKTVEMQISSVLSSRVIKQKTFIGKSNFKERIDVRDLEKGLYILTVRVDNFVKSIKFIKE